MKTLLSVIFGFLVFVPTAFADPVTLEWQPPLVITTPLTGYKIHVSQTPGVYNIAAPKGTIGIPPAGVAPTFSYTETVNGVYYAVVTAYNADGESAYSNEITFKIPRPVKPNAPTNLRVK